jgi:hypothetical protein
VVKVDDNSKMVYVRITGRGVVEALNLGIVERFNLPVIVGYSHERPEVLQVLEVWTGGMAEPGPYSYLPLHYESHEFRNPYGGEDWVPIQKQAIVPMVAHPTKPSSMVIYIEDDIYAWGSGWVWWDGDSTIDLSGYVPASTAQARYVTISIDGATETIQYGEGDLFQIIMPPEDRDDLIPAAPSGSIPIVAVYLPGGVTKLEWDNLYDIRLFNQPMGGSLTPGPHGLLDSSVHDDTLTRSPSPGSLIYGVTGTFWSELIAGDPNDVLQMDASGTYPAWGPISLDFNKIVVARYALAVGNPFPTVVINLAGNVVEAR